MTTYSNSRRKFISDSGALGLAAVGACVGGALALDRAWADDTAASKESRTYGAAETPQTSTPDVPDTTRGGELNPQEDYTSYTTDYSAIFSPLTIAGHTLKNRLVKSCASSEMQKTNDEYDVKSIAFYEAFCKGGIGMIDVEGSHFIPGDPYMMPQLDISTDEGIEAHKPMPEMAHKYGTVAIVQMMDMICSTGTSSSIVHETPFEMCYNSAATMQTTEDLHKEQQAFIDAAVRYQKAGFDGIELNASCNHYFSTYLSRYINRERTDEYSGESVENRARILTEIIAAVRKKCGPDFIIEVLYSGTEGRIDELGYDELCTSLDEACEMAELFEAAGASCLHIRSQVYGHHCAGFMPDSLHIWEHGDTGFESTVDYGKHLDGAIVGKWDGAAGLLNVAATIKSHVSIPVGVVGNMDPRLAPDILNNAIRDGLVDYFLMTRPLMADMALPKKLQEGRRDEVAPCVRCMTCFAAPFEVPICPEYCRVNPAMTRAYSDEMPEGYDPLPAKGHESVMIIGAGPAGLECARVAAQRGYPVTLYEKRDDTAGLMNLAMKVKGPHERIIDHKRYLDRQMEVQGVSLTLGKEVDLDFIAQEGPDVVIVAVGGVADEIPFENDGKEIYTLTDFADYGFSDEPLPLGERVVVYGAQFQAATLACSLAKQGKTVTMVNPGPEDDLFLNTPTWPRMMGKPWLRKMGVKLYHDAVVQEARDGEIIFQTNYGTVKTVPYDSLVDARPLLPNRELYDAVCEMEITKKQNGEDYTYTPTVFAIGDCYSTGTIAHNTARANLVARSIGENLGEPDAPLEDNQVRGKAVGFGDISVTLTVEGGKITAAKVNTSYETAGIGKETGETFAQQIMETGTVDVITGATETSRAVQEALASAKSQAAL